LGAPSNRAALDASAAAAPSDELLRSLAPSDSDAVHFAQLHCASASMTNSATAAVPDSQKSGRVRTIGHI
jgi:hypothetical protein